MQHQKDKSQDDGTVLQCPCMKLNGEPCEAGMNLLNYLSTWQILSVKNFYALNLKEWWGIY